MSGSPQDMFLQAMGAMFSSSLPAPAVLAAANAFIFDFSQHRDCFFTCMLILNEPVTDIAIRAFCANILYNKVSTICFIFLHFLDNFIGQLVCLCMILSN